VCVCVCVCMCVYVCAALSVYECLCVCMCVCVGEEIGGGEWVQAKLLLGPVTADEELECLSSRREEEMRGKQAHKGRDVGVQLGDCLHTTQ
jgi:hypothetical protein